MVAMVVTGVAAVIGGSLLALRIARRSTRRLAEAVGWRGPSPTAT
jgi:hypothetical protein